MVQERLEPPAGKPDNMAVLNALAALDDDEDFPPPVEKCKAADCPLKPWSESRKRCTDESQVPSIVMTASRRVRLGARRGRAGDRLRGDAVTGARRQQQRSLAAALVTTSRVRIYYNIDIVRWYNTAMTSLPRPVDPSGRREGEHIGRRRLGRTPKFRGHYTQLAPGMGRLERNGDAISFSDLLILAASQCPPPGCVPVSVPWPTGLTNCWNSR